MLSSPGDVSMMIRVESCSPLKSNLKSNSPTSHFKLTKPSFPSLQNMPSFYAVTEMQMDGSQLEKLIDAKIEVRYNYTSFVPANIVISDEFGDNFIINTVQHPKARWLVERSVRVHGSFKTKVAEEFDERNPLAEAYTYNGFQAIPPESSKFFSGHLHNNSDKHSYSNPIKAKNDSSSNSDSDLNKNLERKSVEISTINEVSVYNDSRRRKPKLKSYYRIKNDSQALNEDQLNISKGSENENKPLHLMIDMGAISPLDPQHKSENNQTMDANNNNMTKLEEVNHNKASQMKDSRKRILPQVDSSNNNLTIERSKTTSTNYDQDEDKAFKLKLVNWLKDNELKLSSKYASEAPSSSTNPLLLIDQNLLVSSHGPLGEMGNT
ncbi:hypothetical protein E5676_scaffold264G00780 [Cucumis melo var. makuwa]|uniref:Uncharacterized protein n=1 Tax=Cucumis melo var. makuwa TaxID=1194695 RepID=A0A5D3BPD1_CUCMM|nr:hypothetical protein E5676_scaffold264G00780 [Cucumis melo var. makuwa]